MNMVIRKSALMAAVSLLALELHTSSATAQDWQPYVSVFGGASALSDLSVNNVGSTNYVWQFNSGYILGGAVGVKWNDMLRSELELSHAVWSAKNWAATYDGGYNGAASGNLSATYLLGNVWLDIPTHSMVTPYLGGGLGIGWANANVTADNGTQLLGGNSGLAMQVGAGVKFAISNQVDVDFGYRYKNIMNITFSDQNGNPWSPVNLASHNFQVGLTVKF